MKDKKTNIFKKLLKNKILVTSIAFYILLPIVFVFAIKSNTPYRTSGEYLYYENNVLSSKIILTADNKAKIYFYSGDYTTDKEYEYKELVDNWSYRKSNWMDNYDPKEYHHLSLEYIRFGGKTSECYFIYFKIGNKLYSDFLIDESRGGGQKCYTKK